jgi:hypothetical protein
MKTYTIEQVYCRYHNLLTKAKLKKAWNKEAKSYEINIDRIKDACHLKLISGSPLNDNEKYMLTVITQGK